MSLFEFVKLILAVWYIAYAVTGTHGPGGIFEWMREKLPHGRRHHPHWTLAKDPAKELMSDDKVYPGLLDCIICFAPWVAALVLLIASVDVLVNILALAGGALLLHSFTGWRFGE